MVIDLNVEPALIWWGWSRLKSTGGQTSRTAFEAPGLAASRSAQHDWAVQPNVSTFSKNRMLPGACPLRRRAPL